MYYNHEELKEMIAAKFTIDEIMDILGWEMKDFVEAISDDIDLYAEEFEIALQNS